MGLLLLISTYKFDDGCVFYISIQIKSSFQNFYINDLEILFYTKYVFIF